MERNDDDGRRLLTLIYYSLPSAPLLVALQLTINSKLMVNRELIVNSCTLLTINSQSGGVACAEQHLARASIVDHPPPASNCFQPSWLALLCC